MRCSERSEGMFIGRWCLWGVPRFFQTWLEVLGSGRLVLGRCKECWNPIVIESVQLDVLVLIVIDGGEVGAGFDGEPKLVETSGQYADNGQPRDPSGDEGDEPSRT